MEFYGKTFTGLGSLSSKILYQAFAESHRVVDLRSRGRWFETPAPEVLCCVLEQDI